MPFVFEELFKAAGKKLEDYIEIYKLDTICRYFWDDGSSLDAKHDVKRMQEQIGRISAKDSLVYPDYLNYTKEIYDISAPVFLYSPFCRAEDIFNKHTFSIIPKLYKLDAWRTVHKANKSYFSDPRIVQLFDRYATYNGSNPYLAPATLNIITYVEYALGSYGIKGGTRKLSQALKNLAIECGVKINLNEKVNNIQINNSIIDSIITDKESYSTKHSKIISNMDVVDTYQKIIKKPKKYVDKLSKIEPSISGYIICWGIKGVTNKLSLHNIFFSIDYEKEFEDIFNKKIISDDPTYYISVSSRHAEGDAPEGNESWFILINAPYLPHRDNDRQSQYVRLKNKLIEKLSKAGIEMEGRIEYEHLIDQSGLYDRYGSNKGSIYGTSSNSQFAAFKRPSVNDPNYDNLYFCGGSSHPGGGMPLVALSGKHASTVAQSR